MEPVPTMTGDGAMGSKEEADAHAAALSNTLSRMSIKPASPSLSKSPAPPVNARQMTAAETFNSAAQSLKQPAPAMTESQRSSGALVDPGPYQMPKLPRLPSGTNALLATPTRSVSQTMVEPAATTGSALTQASASQEIAPLTAGSIAAAFFRQELATHETSHVTAPDTVVFVHDACYGHRYSRRKATKTTLNLIVERPERIQAGVLGISSAYVRLGERHAGGRNAIQPQTTSNSKIPFTIRRTTRLVSLQSSVVTNVHGAEWMEELTTMCNAAESRLTSGGKELTRTEGTNDATPKAHLHEGDLYLSHQSLTAFQGALGGVLDGVDEIFKPSETSAGPKKAFVCIRPPGHHCSSDLPSGFCWLNNVHVGIEHAAQTHGLTHAAIIDFDLHHGDGSQSITWERNAKAAELPKNAPISKKTSIGYFSIHDINSYPCEYGEVDKVRNASLCIENAHGQSVWNVHLQPWRTEAEFWDLYRTRYITLLGKARAFLRAQTERIRATNSSITPKAAIFISAGFDASEWEGQGMQRHKVNVPTEFYARFTSDINRLAEEEGTSVEGRVISVLEGGYSDRALMSGVLSHLTGLVGYSPPANTVAGVPTSTPRQWWGAEAMNELETIVKGATPEVPKRSRTSEPTFHASPTASFLAKVVDPSKVDRKPPSSNTSLVPLPVPQDIDWATAAFELSRLLIPTDRQINSCRHEELSEPRVKRDRTSTVGFAPTDAIIGGIGGMTLRGGRSKGASQPPSPVMNEAGPAFRAAPRKSRKSIVSELPASNDQTVAASEGSKQSSSSAMQAAMMAARVSREPAPRIPEPSKTSQMAAAAQGADKIYRTRRVSGAQNNLANSDTSEAPPMPPLPRQFSSDAKTNSLLATKGPSTASQTREGSADVDNLVSGVKKITLRFSPKKKSPAPEEPSQPEAAQPAVRKERPKSVMPKTLRTGPPKTTAPKPPAPALIAPVPPRATSARKTIPPAPVKATSNTLGGPVLSSAGMQLLGGSSPQRGSASTMPLPASEAKPAASEAAIADAPIIAPEDPATSSEAGSWVQVNHSNSSPQTAGPPLKATQGDSFREVSGPVSNARDLEAWSTPSNLQDQELITPATSSPKTSLAAATNPWVEDFMAKAGHVNNIGSATVAPQDKFMPYNPPGTTLHNFQPMPSNDSRVKSEPLTWLLPNTNTPVRSPAKPPTFKHLPIFTAEGHIPFATPTKVVGSDGGIVQEPEQELQLRHIVAGLKRGSRSTEEGEGDIWAVPETPAQ